MKNEIIRVSDGKSVERKIAQDTGIKELKTFLVKFIIFMAAKFPYLLALWFKPAVTERKALA